MPRESCSHWPQGSQFTFSHFKGISHINVINFMLKRKKINHFDTALETATNSIHAATERVGDLLEWIRGADFKDFTPEREPKAVIEWNRNPWKPMVSIPRCWHLNITKRISTILIIYKVIHIDSVNIMIHSS